MASASRGTSPLAAACERRLEEMVETSRSKFTNQAYLQTDQYRDASNLNARVQLHRQFSTNPYGWPRWVFDQFSLPSECAVLELGCGPGHLWLENVERIPGGWEIVLSDLSPGMLRAARQNLLPSGRALRFGVIDAQDIPLAAGSFDAVIANHMLYHVPDRERALAEIHRVLKPRGRFYATTNGRAHMRELIELVRWFQAEGPETQGDEWERSVGSFSLETGMAQLSPWFAEIQVERYEDGLLITDIEPLVAYVMSSISLKVERGRVEEFKRFLQREVMAEGAIRIGKDSGIFKAVRGDGTPDAASEGSAAPSPPLKRPAGAGREGAPE